MNTRLEQLMRAENLSSAKFAEILGVQPSSISHLLSGRNNPNFDFISKLFLMFPLINPHWIINGQGDMYVGAQKQDNTLNLVDKVDLHHKRNGATNSSINTPKSADVESVIEFPDVTSSSNSVDSKSDIFVEKSLFDDVDNSVVTAPLEADNEPNTTTHKESNSISKPSDTVSKVLLLYKNGRFEFFGNN